MNLIIKYLFIGLIGMHCAFAKRVNLDNLPAPYNELNKLYPFVDHGWYQNAAQLHQIFTHHDIRIIVEVGSWLGKSTFDMARYLPLDGIIYAVDTWKGSAEHQKGHSGWHPCMPYLYEQFLSNVIHKRATDKIIPMRMTSLEAASFLDIEPDLIYLDAAHDKESVYQDLTAWYPFVKGRGILCGDDWAWQSVRAAILQFAEENDLIVEHSYNFWRLHEN